MDETEKIDNDADQALQLIQSLDKDQLINLGKDGLLQLVNRLVPGVGESFVWIFYESGYYWFVPSREAHILVRSVNPGKSFVAGSLSNVRSKVAFKKIRAKFGLYRVVDLLKFNVRDSHDKRAKYLYRNETGQHPPISEEHRAKVAESQHRRRAKQYGLTVERYLELKKAAARANTKFPKYLEDLRSQEHKETG